MKKFKMPGAFTILMLIIIIVAILTWVIPAGQYQQQAGKPIPQSYQHTEQNRQGVWEILKAPIKGFYEAREIDFFILVIGGFLAVVMKTGAIDAGISSVISKLKGREQIMIPILMILFGLGGTTYGMAEETIAFYPLVIPVMLAAGYDAITAVSVILLGAGLGVLGSTVNPFSTGIAAGFADISIGEGIILRTVLLIITEAVGIFYVMHYASKVKENPENSLVYNQREANRKHFLTQINNKNKNLTKKRQGVLLVFAVTFIIMIISVIPWAYKFNINIFEKFNTALQNTPILGPLLGNIPPMGDFWFTEMSILFLVSSFVIALISGMGEQEYVDTLIAGAKDLLAVALIIAVSRGITVIMNDGRITATILHWGERMLADLNSFFFVNLAYLFYIPMSFLVPSTSGLATLSMPIMAPLADFVGVGRDLIVTAFQSAAGIVNLITPTSGVVMGALAIARVDYAKWLKFTAKLLLILMITIMILLTLATII
ncbi:YfcC family protein [Halanaerobium salsuginis]|uniref:Uncharacterized membrane protein YfcC, ion transporter superfamily n=1 Tax=Halanaerobium salsuginis TaxID=29563 RepID=A0A1I4MY66_9FIRM|nr:YfcC family protein [Halanaerobium salsuginis]SFM07953.1 Uncharacterized membrane protein YfcC, ion transporter superfamily [Halanaerobium salsuginis]